MPIEPIIRDAVETDVDTMSLLLEQLFNIEQDFSVDRDKQRRGLQRLLECEQAKILVVEIEGRVIGMVTLQILISTAEGGPVGLLEDMAVDEAFRDQGIGEQLLKRMEEWSKTQGLPRLQLLADRNNTRALDFYLRQGWTATELIGLRRRLPIRLSP
ncbi:MAG: GNAT family N-acetyltransferase [Candidatus Thiodiazotropha endolucinida]|nr:GNAT family N-acetyltransferase [Candidatus Thiodiazotropha endolucinida]